MHNVQSEVNTLLRIINICDTSWKLQKWSYAMNTNYVPQCCFIWSLYTLYSTYTTTTVQHPKNIMPHAYGYGRGPAVCLIYVAKKLFYGLFGSCLARSTYILTCNVTQTQCADLESNILAVFIRSQILVLPNPKYCFSKSWIQDQNFPLWSYSMNWFGLCFNIYLLTKYLSPK